MARCLGTRVLVGDARADRVSDADILEHVIVPHASRGHPLGRAAGSQSCLRPGLRRHCDSNFDSATRTVSGFEFIFLNFHIFI